MANDQVSVEISIEEKAALRALTKLSKGIDKFENNVTTSVKKSDRAFDSFKGNLAAIATSGAISAISSGLKDLVVGSFETAAAFEKINTQLEVLTGSQEKATALFEQLKEFSAGTPFQLQGIGSTILQKVKEHAESQSYSEVSTFVYDKNTDSKAFLESKGFVSDRTIDVSSHPFFQGISVSNIHRMRCSL